MKYCYPCKHIPFNVLQYKRSSTKLTIGKITQIVCGYYHMNVVDIRSKKRSKEICITRQTAVYLCMKNLTYSTIPIVMKFFNRHRTSHYSLKKTVENQLKVDKNYAATMDKLQRSLNSLKLNQV